MSRSPSFPPFFRCVAELPERLGERECLLVSALIEDCPSGESLSASERHRAGRMAEIPSRRFIAARSLLRSVLTGILRCSSGDIVLEVDSSGKPHLRDHSLHVSISHTGETVAVAVSRLELGLDMEEERELDGSVLARRFFTAEEADAVSRDQGGKVFFKLWSCREAASKGDGRGLSTLLSMTRMLPDQADGTLWNHVLIGSETWRCLHWIAAERRHMALAFRETPALISWCDLSGGLMV